MPTKTHTTRDRSNILLGRTIAAVRPLPGCRGLTIRFLDSSIAALIPRLDDTGRPVVEIDFDGPLHTERPRFRKVRHDSKEFQLTERQREWLLRLLMEETTSLVEAKALAEKEIGMNFSTGWLSGFYRNHCVPLLLRRHLNGIRMHDDP